MNRHPVVLHGEAGVGGLVARGVKLRRCEGDVVGLPLSRRRAHVKEGPRRLVDAAAFIFLAFQPVAVQHLDLVAAMKVNPAVSPGLPFGSGHERGAELQVQVEAAELIPGHQRAAARLHFHRAAGQSPLGRQIRLADAEGLPFRGFAANLRGKSAVENRFAGFPFLIIRAGNLPDRQKTFRSFQVFPRAFR